MSLLMDTQTNRFWARVDFLATGEIALYIPEECELPIRVLVSRGGRSAEYEPSNSEKPNNCEDEPTGYNLSPVDKDINVRSKDEPQTTDYCDVCNHKGCDNCIADGSNPYCVPSHYEPQTERSE